ncbi:hypothetical protein O9993_23290 [Vibrio lentus]|nr:hypothetical protein [Vibrio lentus]
MSGRLTPNSRYPSVYGKIDKDKNLSAAQYQVGAAKSQKDTLLSCTNAQVIALLVDKANLTQRLERHQSTLVTSATSARESVRLKEVIKHRTV